MRLSIYKYLTVFLVMLLMSCFFMRTGISYAAENDISEIIWLDFKMPPDYDKEREEIRKSDKVRWEARNVKHKEDCKKNETKYRKEYEKEYSQQPDYLKSHPFKCPAYEPLNFDYDALALLATGPNKEEQYAYIVSDVGTEGNFNGEAVIRIYKKIEKAHCNYLAEYRTKSDVGVVGEGYRLIDSGCWEGGFVSPRGDGDVITFSRKKIQP